MPRLHVSRHTGQVTNRIHVPRAPRFVATASIMPNPYVEVQTPAVVTINERPARVVERRWTCGSCLAYTGAALAAISGIAAAIIGLLLLSPAVIIIGAVVALTATAFIPVNYRHQLI